MAKNNMLVIAGVVVALAALGGSGFLLYRGFSNLTQNRNQLNGAVSMLKDYAEKDPYPSQDNINRQRENVKNLQTELVTLTAQIRANQVEEKVLSKSAFIDRLTVQMTTYRNLAQKQKVVLPAAFAFGFDKYLVKGFPVPNESAVPKMAEQLSVMQEVTLILCEARVQEVIKVARDEFEIKADEEAPSEEPAPAPESPDASNQVNFVSYEGQLYTKLFFTVEFKAKEDALVRVLNKLAAAKNFIVVNSVKIEKEVPDVAEHEATSPAVVVPDATDEEVEPVAAAEDSSDSAPVLRKDRILCGAEVEKPMKVTLVLEAFRFMDAKATEAGKEEAAK